MRRCYDGRRTKWLDRFFRSFREAALKRYPGISLRDLDDLDGLVVLAVLQEILAPGWAVGNFGGHYVAPSLVADNLGLSTKTVRRVLKPLARAGILLGVRAYDRIRGRYLPIELIVNPGFREAIDAGLAGKPLTQTADIFAEIWLERRDAEEDVQGFSKDERLKWGCFSKGERFAEYIDRPQSREAPMPKLVGKIRDALDQAKAGKRLDQKAQKEKAREERRATLDRIVAASAVVWKAFRAREGFGTDEAPAWAAPMRDLPEVLRKERASLEKIFEVHGGLKSALAWNLFCSGRNPNPTAKPVFDPSKAHINWVTPDKRPSAFAKHFDLVMSEVIRLGWLKNEPTIAALTRVYGATISLPPKTNFMTSTLTAEEEGATTSGH